MYGYYHPLYARHLILMEAYDRAALLRQTEGEAASSRPPASRPTPSPTRALTRWIALLVTVVIAAGVVGALMVIDPSSASGAAKSPDPVNICTLHGVKVRSIAPCPSAA